MTIRGKGRKERLKVLGQQTVALDFVGEGFQGLRVGQVTINQEVGDLYETGFPSQFLNWVAAVTQHPVSAVNVGNLGFAVGGITETVVQSDVASTAQQFVDFKTVVALRGLVKRGIQSLLVRLDKVLSVILTHEIPPR